MVEFCTCGSIVINDHCTNKNCVNRPAGKSSTAKSTRKKTSSTAKKEPKTSRTRKSSKCITYNLYEIKEEENVN